MILINKIDNKKQENCVKDLVRLIFKKIDSLVHLGKEGTYEDILKVENCNFSCENQVGHLLVMSSFEKEEDVILEEIKNTVVVKNDHIKHSIQVYFFQRDNDKDKLILNTHKNLKVVDFHHFIVVFIKN